MITVSLPTGVVHVLEIQTSTGLTTTILLHPSGAMVALPGTSEQDVLRAALPLHELMRTRTPPVAALADLRRSLLCLLKAHAHRFDVAGWLTVKCHGSRSFSIVSQYWIPSPPHNRPFREDDPRLWASDLDAPRVPGPWHWRGSLQAGVWVGSWVALSRPQLGSVLVAARGLHVTLAEVAAQAAEAGGDFCDVTLGELMSSAVEPAR